MIIDTQNIITQKAKGNGFSHIGFSKAVETDQQFQTHFNNWLRDENHAEMNYLERNKEKRFDPRKLHEGTKTIISLLYPYEKAKQTDNCKIASYAHGEDYHTFLRKKIESVLNFIKEILPNHKPRFFVDSAPVADRYWAWKSGLGFIGKNGFLIHPENGSRFFIGHIFTAIDFMEYKETHIKQACGTCTKCIDACPTNAIDPQKGLNANLCISYHTIESKEAIPRHITEKNPNWVYGCDICQNVCPYNHKTILPSPELHSTWPGNPSKDEWLNMTKEEFKTKFKGTPLERTGLEKIRSNIKLLVHP